MPDASIIKSFIILISTVIGLGLVLLFIKKYVKRGRRFPNQIDLRVLSKISLLPKSHLFLIKAGGKTLLLGVTDQNISTLADFSASSDSVSQQKAVEKYRQASNTTTEPHNNFLPNDSLSFSNFLRSAFKRTQN